MIDGQYSSNVEKEGGLPNPQPTAYLRRIRQTFCNRIIPRRDNSILSDQCERVISIAFRNGTTGKVLEMSFPLMILVNNLLRAEPSRDDHFPRLYQLFDNFHDTHLGGFNFSLSDRPSVNKLLFQKFLGTI